MKKKIYCADWLLPVSTPAIQNGAIVTENGIICEIGPREQVLEKHQAPCEIVPHSVIAPGWVNAHCHLELSYLHKAIGTFENLVDWISQLVHLRTEPIQPDQVKITALEQMRRMRNSGTVLIGDITNGPLLASFGDEALPDRIVFYEILGFQKDKAGSIMSRARQLLKEVNPQARIVPHAPYSTSADLIGLISRNSQKLTIHAAESAEETQFIKTGDGPFKDFLQERNVWDDSFEGQNQSPVWYLREAGAVTEKMLLVHGLQVNDEDIRDIKKGGSTVCICARSNRFLKVGRPPLEKYLEAEVPLCIGTDSLASNPDLDLNAEIAYIYKNFDIADPALLLEMATINGAAALGMDNLYGSLDPGKKAQFNIFSGRSPVKSDPERFIFSNSWNQLQCI